MDYKILLSAPGPVGFIWVLELEFIETWLGLGSWGFGTLGLGLGLDNKSKIPNMHSSTSSSGQIRK